MFTAMPGEHLNRLWTRVHPIAAEILPCAASIGDGGRNVKLTDSPAFEHVSVRILSHVGILDPICRPIGGALTKRAFA